MFIMPVYTCEPRSALAVFLKIACIPGHQTIDGTKRLHSFLAREVLNFGLVLDLFTHLDILCS